jgi:hypothetical protein
MEKEPTMTDTETVPFQVRMPAEMHRALKGVSYFSGRSMNDLAVAAFQYYLESEHEAIQEIIGRALDDYRSALDKLKDM